MKLEHRTKWVEALRSGRYLQGNGFLKVTRNNESHHCCLDVLCEVLRSELTFAEITEASEDNRAAITMIDGNNGRLSESLMQQLSLTTNAHDHLIHLNDAVRKTFSEIADWIEENIEADTEETAGSVQTV